MKNSKIYLLVIALLFTGLGFNPVFAAGDEVEIVAGNLLHSVNVNPTQEATDIYAHWLQKAHPEVNMSVAFTQDYFMAADLYYKGSYSCVTLNPEVIVNPKVANYKIFKGSVCTDVLKVLAPYITTENYITYTKNLLSRLEASINAAVLANKSADSGEVYLNNAFTAISLPPELTGAINNGELTITSSVVSGLLFKLTVTKDASSLIKVSISNLSTPNVLADINLFTGEFPASTPYLSTNSNFNQLLGNEQYSYGIKTILNGVLLEKYNASKGEIESYFKELASVVTSSRAMLSFKYLPTGNFEFTSDAGNICFSPGANTVTNLVFIVSKDSCNGSYPTPKGSGNSKLVNSEAKKLLDTLVKHAANTRKSLTIKDYNIDLTKYVGKEGIGYSVKGKVISIFDINYPLTKASITFNKFSLASKIPLIKSGLKLKLTA